VRIISWFSCGIASATATKLTIDDGIDITAVYCDTHSEHLDNVRFKADCENLFKQKITTLHSDKYDDIWDVFEKTRFLRSIKGARCTTELKKKLRQNFQRDDDIHIFGYTSDEQNRADNMMKNNPELSLRFPLIEKGMTKAMCFDYFSQFNIKQPEMYSLGFNNNNCIGCVKGGKGYWNHIRKHFPEQFNRMALLERHIGISVVRDEHDKPLFLDELPPDRGIHHKKYIEDLFAHGMSCDFLCGGQ